MAIQTVSQPEESSQLKLGISKTLTTFDLVCLGINGVVGTGIFALPGIIAVSAGKFSPLLYLVCGLFCFSIALCFAEMGGAFTRTGGAYVYATEAFGPFVGFMVGWEIWIASLIGWASVATSFGLALDYFYPAISTTTQGKVILGVLIIALSILNFFGVKMGAYASNVFSVAKLIPLVLFVFLGLPHLDMAAFSRLGFPGWAVLSAGLLNVLYIYTGFEELPLPASEVKDPQKSIPKAILIVLLGVTLFYMLIQFVAQASFAGITAEKSAPLAKAALSFAGVTGGVLVGIGAIISMAGVNSGIALTGPRSLYALARDGFLPGFLAKLHPVFQTPYTSIIVNSSIVLFLALTGTFAQLVCLSALASLLQYIPTCLAVLVLRYKKPDMPRSFVIPGGPVIPLIGVILCFWLFSHASLQEIYGSLFAMLLSVPLYFIFHKKQQHPGEAAAER